MKILYLFIFFLGVLHCFSQTVTDYDGNVYNTVTIGTQVWMKQNLKVTHYRNGDPIPNVTDNSAWNALTSGAFCSYNNDNNNVSTYGLLYNYYTISDTRKVCPSGWHVPEDWELTTVDNLFGGTSVAGGKLKEAGTSHWASPNTGATNESNFTFLPGGMRFDNGTYQLLGTAGFEWSSTMQGAYNTWYRWFGNTTAASNKNPGSLTYGFSIRCLSDNAAGMNENQILYKIFIYPNPVSNYLIIDNQGTENISATVYNVLGSELFTKNLNGKINQIDTRALESGIYVIVITGKSGKLIQQKFIKE